MSAENEPPFDSPMDLRLRVIGVMLEPALTLACIMRLPLSDVTQLMRTTYVRIGRARGSSIRALAKRFGVAPNTIQSISNVLRDHGLAERFGAAVSRRRAIVQHLTLQPDSTRAAIYALDADSRPADMDDALEHLREEGIIHVEGDRVTLAKPHLLIARKDPLHRLDSLRQMAETFSKVVYRRFFHPPIEGEAYGRVFTFACSPQDLVALREEAYVRLSQSIRAADARATNRADGVIASVMLVVVQEPDDALYRTRKKG